jgi:hypothetical protein
LKDVEVVVVGVVKRASRSGTGKKRCRRKW